MRKQIYTGLLVMLLQSAVWAQPAKKVRLVIEGQVIDSEGSPTAGVMVSAHPDALSGKVPRSSTDKEGKFTIVVPKTGFYMIGAAKQSEGYQSSYDPFYDPAGESLAQALVEENRAAPFVTIRLGPKAGKIAGKTVDADTNGPVEQLQIRLCRADVPRYCHRLSAKYPGGQFQVFVPAAPFTIQISAAGYHDWYGTDGVSQQEPLQVASNTTRELRVSLQKLSARDNNIPSLSVLGAPDQLSPANGTEFIHYPRLTRLEWSVVPGAVSYTVELEFCMPGGPDGKECKDPRPLEYRLNPPMSLIERTSYDFLFLGSQPGRWRVWAVDRQGRAGTKSAWSYFIFIYRP